MSLSFGLSVPSRGFRHSIAGIPYLAESQTFSLFLSRSKGFEEAVKEFDKRTPSWFCCCRAEWLALQGLSTCKSS